MRATSSIGQGSSRAALRICLTVGILQFALAAWLGPAQPRLLAIDSVPGAWFESMAESSPWWVVLWTAVNLLLAPWTWLVLASLCALGTLLPFPWWTAERRARRAALRIRLLIWSGLTIVGGLLPLLVKRFVQRPRPDLGAALVPLSAFPSWPAATVTVALIGGWLVFSKVWFRRRWPIWLAAATVALTCFAQLALAQVHLTDSLGGISLSLSFLGFSLLLIRAVAPRHA